MATFVTETTVAQVVSSSAVAMGPIPSFPPAGPISRGEAELEGTGEAEAAEALGPAAVSAQATTT